MAHILDIQHTASVVEDTVVIKLAAEDGKVHTFYLAPRSALALGNQITLKAMIAMGPTCGGGKL